MEIDLGSLAAGTYTVAFAETVLEHDVWDHPEGAAHPTGARPQRGPVDDPFV